MIDSAKSHSIVIYKHEMDLKLYALTFKVGKCITRTFFLKNLSKYNLIINLNILLKLCISKNFLYLNKRSSQRWWTIIIKCHHPKHYISINSCFNFFCWNEVWTIIPSFHLIYLKIFISWYSMLHVKWNQ